MSAGIGLVLRVDPGCIVSIIKPSRTVWNREVPGPTHLRLWRMRESAVLMENSGVMGDGVLHHLSWLLQGL